MSNASLELGGGKWAAKEGNLLGYASSTSSSKYVPREFSFTRAADIAATRINSSGLIEKYRENLAKNTDWEGASLDTAPTDYTGYLLSNGTFNTTSTEGQIRFTTDSSSRAIVITSNISETGIFTQSVYVDEVYTSLAVIDVINRSSSATAIGYYEDGVEITAYTNVQAGKRYSILWNKTGAASFRFGSGVNSSLAGDIVLSRPQIERGLVATELIVSPVGSTGKAGVLDNLPRIDYTGGTASLLLEPQRTNLIPHSEYFGVWQIQPNTTTAELTQETLSPEGLYNAYKFAGDGSSGFYKASVGTYGGENTKSIYLKAAVNGTQVVLKDPNQTVTTKTLTLTTDWVRYELTETQTSSFGIWIDDIPSDPIYAWGAQVEEGSYATSYIPNHSGGSVTRNTDVTLSLTNAGADGLINNYNTTIFINLKKIISVNNVIRFVTLFPNGGANNPRVLLYGNMSNALVQYRVTGQADQSITSPYNRDEVNKIAIRISGTSLTMFHNGEEVNTITIVQGDDLEYLSLAESAATDSGYLLNQLLSFPTALSDDECIALTS